MKTPRYSVGKTEQILKDVLVYAVEETFIGKVVGSILVLLVGTIGFGILCGKELIETRWEKSADIRFQIRKILQMPLFEKE